MGFLLDMLVHVLIAVIVDNDDAGDVDDVDS